MSRATSASLVVNGWTIFAHPLFLDQLELLIQQVEAFRQKDAVNFVKKNATKRLAAIAKLAFEVIPQDPARAEYRQGNTLGATHTWVHHGLGGVGGCEGLMTSAGQAAPARCLLGRNVIDAGIDKSTRTSAGQSAK